MYQRPEPGEYSSYYAGYIQLIPEGDLVSILENQAKETNVLLKGLSDTQVLFRYGEGKWSIKEVLGHMADTERVMAYRLLAIARGERAELPGFDESLYVHEAGFDSFPIGELLENFLAVRHSTVQLIKSLGEAAWTRAGSANGASVSVRAIASIIAGHELHHRKIIMERYIGADSFPKW